MSADVNVVDDMPDVDPLYSVLLNEPLSFNLFNDIVVVFVVVVRRLDKTCVACRVTGGWVAGNGGGNCLTSTTVFIAVCAVLVELVLASALVQVVVVVVVVVLIAEVLVVASSVQLADSVLICLFVC
jgi:hypothetical protein